MMRNWKLLALPAIVTAVLTVDPTVATAGGTAETGKNKVMEKLTQMDKRLEEAFRNISEDMVALKADALISKRDLQKAQDKIDELEKDMAQTQKDLAQMRVELQDLKKRGPSTTQALYPPSEKAGLDAITNRLSKIEQDLTRLNNPARVSLSPAATGRVKLVNDSFEDLLFIVNGRPYRVGSNVTQVLEQVPAGALVYEVMSPTLGLRGRNTPTLAAGETFTITAR